MIPKIAARTGKILLGQIKPWRSAHVTGERGAPCRLPSASRVSRQCHNRGAVGQSKHRILLPLKAISSGKKKKKKEKKVDLEPRGQCCKLSWSGEMAAAKEPKLSYISQHTISPRLYFIYGFPLQSQHGLCIKGALRFDDSLFSLLS